MSALDDVLDALARTHGDASAIGGQLGEIALLPQQRQAAVRLRAALDEFGGAMLADDPGMGKTYAALAVAAELGGASVVAPASLRTMWAAAAARAAVPISFTSFEILSRGRRPAHAPVVIVDEAHRAANPGTRRYRTLSEAAHQSRVLLLSATPVRNRRAEFIALLALFLGPAADTADDALIARCVYRRRVETSDASLPRSIVHRTIGNRGGRQIESALRALPPPLPLADGQAAAGLVATGLARCWASSLAALDRAVVRRIQRAAALDALLAEGRLPSRGELAAWSVGDDGMQLAFPFLAAPTAQDIGPLRATLSAHRYGLEHLRTLIAPRIASDTAWRAAALRRVGSVHSGAIVVAFTAFEATASALFATLRHDSGVALVTGNDARSAGGSLARAEILAALAVSPGTPRTDTPTAQRAMELRLVIATDLMAEGVNLQGASVVFHLDQPWTPAAIVQREGRVARVGSPHATVHYYRIAPSPAMRRLLDMTQTHVRKERAAVAAQRAGETSARIGDLLMRWRRPLPARRQEFSAATAAVAASRNALLARVDRGSRSLLVAGFPFGDRRWRLTTDPAMIERVITAIRGQPREVFADLKVIQPAARAVAAWLAQRRAATLAGAGDLPSLVRRRVLARLEAVVSNAPPRLRPALAARVARTRAGLASARGAGVEVRLDALLDLESGVEAWLDRLDECCAAPTRLTEVPAGDELSALLLLRREPI